MLKKFKNILYRSLEHNDISYQNLQEMVKKNKKAILLDVRSPQEFKEGHLEGAINIPIYDLESKIDMLSDKCCTIIVYCASGYRSRQAKEKLKKLGYQEVYNLKNGLDGIN